jgi:hypothetical protein
LNKCFHHHKSNLTFIYIFVYPSFPGTIFNTETDNYDFTKDTARLVQIRDELLLKHGIGWPGNTDNFNLESCETHAAMCCYVSSRDPTNDTGEPIDNTDVCVHNMADAQTSSHVRGGESIFVDEGPVNCHGFFWNEGDRYKGNLLFHVAMSEGLIKNQYVRNVPGAPMCGCVEQMPVVTHSDCTDMTVSEDFQVTFDEELSIKAIGDPVIDFVSCGGDGSLTSGYAAEQLPGKIEKYVTGKDDCLEEEAKGLDALAWKQRAADEQWISVAGKGYHYEPSKSTEEFNALFAKSPNQIIRRRCMECNGTHKDIYYRRYDASGLPANFDLLRILKNYWHDIDGNKFHTDFELYSSYDDALSNSNPWLYCNFNDRNVGFPRDCGPLVYTHSQWNAFEPVSGRHHGKYHVAFYVEGENNVAGLPRTQ